MKLTDRIIFSLFKTRNLDILFCDGIDPSLQEIADLGLCVIAAWHDRDWKRYEEAQGRFQKELRCLNDLAIFRLQAMISINYVYPSERFNEYNAWLANKENE